METILNFISFFHFSLSFVTNILFPSYLLGFLILFFYEFLHLHSHFCRGAFTIEYTKGCFVFKIILNLKFDWIL
jgi:hypothetical protein